MEALGSVAESAAFIVAHAVDVSIDSAAVARAKRSLRSHVAARPAWSSHALTPKTRDESTLQWIFVVDTLNFSFWTARGAVPFSCEGHTGYWSLCAAVNRALREGVRLTDAEVMAEMTLAQMQAVFRPDAGAGPVPLLEERLAALREAGRVLREHYGGRVALLVAQAGGSAQQMLQLVTSRMSSYRDWCEHRGRRVWFLKRAQILVADIWAAFGGADYGRFDDINSVTMFADYRVPQLLCALGVLRYSPRLREALLAEEAIGAEWECEIRGASIHAVELLRDDAAGCNAIEIDFYLWDEAKARGAQLDQWPIHKKRTIYYY
jgi:hypothetical protein